MIALTAARPFQFGASSLLLVGALVVAAGSFASAGTMASFSRSASNTGNAFKAAVVNLSATPRQTAAGTDNSAGADIFSGTSTGTTAVNVSSVIPGDSFTRYVTLKNTGDVAANFSFTVSASDDTGTSALVDGGSKSLLLKVSECTDSTFATCTTDVYHTTGNPKTPSVTSDQSLASNVAANGSKYYQVYLTLPSTISDSGGTGTIQGKTATLTFAWKATQNGTGSAR